MHRCRRTDGSISGGGGNGGRRARRDFRRPLRDVAISGPSPVARPARSLDQLADAGGVAARKGPKRDISLLTGRRQLADSKLASAPPRRRLTISPPPPPLPLTYLLAASGAQIAPTRARARAPKTAHQPNQINGNSRRVPIKLAANSAHWLTCAARADTCRASQMTSQMAAAAPFCWPHNEAQPAKRAPNGPFARTNDDTESSRRLCHLRRRRRRCTTAPNVAESRERRRRKQCNDARTYLWLRTCSGSVLALSSSSSSRAHN